MEGKTNSLETREYFFATISTLYMNFVDFKLENQVYLLRQNL